jgi:hypothetical protein
MKRSRKFLYAALIVVLFFSTHQHVCADGRPGTVDWSDGHKLTGAISLTPGKDLRLFTTAGEVAVQLSEVKEVKFIPEKEEMREGFYFPTAGQATQAKTGEVYPTRSIKTQITLADGKVLEGHLFTTTLYVETDANTEKVVLMAKQTGTDNQKLADLIYPTDIHFDDAASPAASSQIDLTQADLKDPHTPVVMTQPDLAVLPVQQVEGKSAWTVPSANSTILLFSVETSDGVHVAWPHAEADPASQQAAQTGLKDM